MVPPSTIARVFSEVSFAKESTRITSSAVALSAEYIRLFIQEAILRANAQRLADDVPTKVDGIDNVDAEQRVLDTYEPLATGDEEDEGGDEDEGDEEDEDGQNDEDDEDRNGENRENDDDHEYDEYDQRGSGISTQLPPANDTNDTLTTRHLVAVSGLLVMDF